MAQPGYGAGHAPDILPSGMKTLAETGSAEPGASHRDATKLSFDHNRQTIPGLGLGFFGKAEPSAARQTDTAANGKQNRANAAASDSAEEGEITADEFEDLYDAQEPVHVAHQEQPVPEIDNSYVEMSDEERDSSGSYSPFLSAKELDAPRPNPVPLPARDPAAIIAPSAEEVQKKPIDIIAEARTQAKDSILRLKTANIGYQDYVNEGIDKVVLDQLFGDLGLATMWKKPAPAAPTGAHPPSNQISSTTSTANGTKPTAEVPLDKSESRKDRIARLLAAKGSKSTKSGAATVIGKIAKSPNMKVNSEKSKLLQQKMEALLKAREEKQRELERQTAMAVSGSPSNQEGISRTSQGAPPAELPSSLQVVAASDQAPQPPALEAGSLSSFAKALPTSNSGSGSASESSFQKPFGQTRPFLIDVSDDDDDIDMDMESPEQRMSILHAPTSPGKRQLPTPSVAQSPGSVNTPPASRQDLEKKIEAMKRKIAEAEAKKRIKLSAPASPAASPRPRAYDIYEAKSSSPDVSASIPHGAASHRLPKVAEAGLVSPGSPKQNRSRAASERLPMLESRRKEQMLRLKALQSQVANIERELKEGLEEEQKLREDLDYISDDDVPMSTGSEPVAPRAVSARAYTEPVANVEQAGQGLANPIDILSPDQIVTDSSSRSSPEVVGAVSIPSNGQGLEAKDPQTLQDEAIEVMLASENDEDVAMDEAASSGEDADDDSDGYEPAEASPYETGHSSPNLKTSDAAPELTDRDPAAAALSAELLSAGRQDSAPIMEREREAPESTHADVNDAPARSSYLAYDSPLRYFHSFRFHPDFNELVAGGLRSATYSNKIDAKLPLCPDEVAGNACPRGKNCHFQHFADMSAPDDQILLQLGAYPKCEESRKQEYIEGLRQLLTDYRNRKVKDFTTLSQGIIEYRAKFHGDASKVLPLGTVAL
ncbi:Zinc finger domain-containing protein, CCCH-type [Cordyceps fumosorosea ARSEF 2679]|uniref:Zinc finger domain-containing protein, CCCH-type n=1 Tax=Cordyceps fumosorosea (strain ARSEF 2679) TaxID=1081104 RepID=A0A167NL51_CORFA|nr:Zinc finger domain-containing protein, CCCH-type [Cordyceps fumosorosea ARSEF 2679]OAA55674.1 Zinc finger domain-containing protein, CCCH-type [Cordyceps fumosorosea ARSEF 2679]